MLFIVRVHVHVAYRCNHDKPFMINFKLFMVDRGQLRVIFIKFSITDHTGDKAFCVDVP